MNLEREIEQIKRRLDRIETVLPGQSTKAEASTPERESLYDLVNFEVKKSQSNVGPEYAYKLTVRNNGRASTRFIGRVKFLDSNEFEVTSWPIDPFTVAAGTSFAKTGVATIIDRNHVPRIASVTAEVYPV